MSRTHASLSVLKPVAVVLSGCALILILSTVVAYAQSTCTGYDCRESIKWYENGN